MIALQGLARNLAKRLDLHARLDALARSWELRFAARPDAIPFDRALRLALEEVGRPTPVSLPHRMTPPTRS